jgi:hypothetical protein
MIELFLTTTNEKLNKMLYIYQFTINQKYGGIGSTVDKNYKILNDWRNQLYSSKIYYDP